MIENERKRKLGPPSPHRYEVERGRPSLRQAVVLAVGISQAQTFVDGNKRTTFAAVDVFLDLNERPIAGSGLAFAKRLEAIATQAFEAWLRSAMGQ